ncbi:MAG TPA: hypothetical protein VNF29_15585, partial [Candidatus Binataceae bacterium]|nr:hypothetical protein [Candidatus Binataceae bacterium]
MNGEAGDSLKVELLGERAGWWKDFSSDEKGGRDLVSLYARTRGIEYRAASDELAELWRIEKPKSELRAVGQWAPIVPIPEAATYGDDGLPSWRTDNGEIVGWWPYLSADGLALSWRVRIDHPNKPRDVLPLTWCRNSDTGACAWRVKDLPSPRPLYGLEWLAAMPDAPVLIVQGEKTADAARRMLPEWVVVTSAGGDHRVSTKYSDWSPVVNRAT